MYIHSVPIQNDRIVYIPVVPDIWAPIKRKESAEVVFEMFVILTSWIIKSQKHADGSVYLGSSIFTLWQQLLNLLTDGHPNEKWLTSEN